MAQVRTTVESAVKSERLPSAHVAPLHANPAMRASEGVCHEVSNPPAAVHSTLQILQSKGA